MDWKILLYCNESGLLHSKYNIYILLVLAVSELLIIGAYRLDPTQQFVRICVSFETRPMASGCGWSAPTPPLDWMCWSGTRSLNPGTVMMWGKTTLAHMWFWVSLNNLNQSKSCWTNASPCRLWPQVVILQSQVLCVVLLLLQHNCELIESGLTTLTTWGGVIMQLIDEKKIRQ